jgi:hypothetical protein
MNKTIILVAAMAMATLNLQANETIDAISQAVTKAVHGTTTEAEAKADETKNVSQENVKEEIKSEEKQAKEEN